MSNVTCQFINTSPAEERSKTFRKATEEHIRAGIDVKEIDGHEGLWYETYDIMSKYVRRPDELREMCAAQFVRMYDTYNKMNKKKEMYFNVLRGKGKFWQRQSK